MKVSHVLLATLMSTAISCGSKFKSNDDSTAPSGEEQGPEKENDLDAIGVEKEFDPNDCIAVREEENSRVKITCGDAEPVYIEDGTDGIDGLPGEKGDQGEKGAQGE